jgi:hypothetical protein
MRKYKKINYWIWLVLLFLVSLPVKVWAGWKLEVGIIPPLNTNAEVSLDQYVTGIYNFAAMAVGIIGVLMFLVGGFQYMISAGNRGMSGEAKKTMINAVIGIILVLGAYLLLSTINKELINFQALNFQ